MEGAVQRIDPRIAMTSYVRARLLREAEEHGRGYQAHVARSAKISPPHIANILGREDLGVGTDVADKLARFWNMTLAELTAEADTWARQHLPQATPSVHPPNLAEALAFLRGRGTVSTEVEEVAAQIAKAGGDLSVGAWIAVLHDLRDLRAAAAAALEPSRVGSKRAAS